MEPFNHPPYTGDIEVLRASGMDIPSPGSRDLALGMGNSAPAGPGPEPAGSTRAAASLLQQVKEQSGTEPNLCYQCRACGNGCPFVAAMDYTPNQIIRLLQFGMQEEALGSRTIWVCVGCHTCSSQCPMSIDIAAIMDVLRLMAMEQGVALGKPHIFDFHQQVLRSLEKYGRAHKLGIMLGYKLQTGNWLKDLDVGLKMLAKRKLELFPTRVRGAEEIAELFRCYWRKPA